MRILLTGANGQVARDIIEQQKYFDHDIIACDKNVLNITDIKSVEHAFDQYHPECVINAAAYTAVDKAEVEEDQAYAVNALGVENLAKICAKSRIPLLHLSTDYVFDGDKSSAYNETDSENPIGIYAKTKFQGEEVLRKNHDLHIILRVSWVFGRYGNNFVKTMLRLMHEKDELNVVSDQKGCPTYAGDIAKVLLTLVDKKNYGTYHYCGTPETNWYDFALEIFHEAKNHRELKVKKINAITTKDYPTPAKRPANSVLDCRKFYETFGLEQVDWKIGLREVIKSYFL